MTFNWTITLGTILSTVAILITLVGGTYKLIYNHLDHLEKRFDRIEFAIRDLQNEMRAFHERKL